MTQSIFKIFFGLTTSWFLLLTVDLTFPWKILWNSPYFWYFIKNRLTAKNNVLCASKNVFFCAWNSQIHSIYPLWKMSQPYLSTRNCRLFQHFNLFKILTFFTWFTFALKTQSPLAWSFFALKMKPYCPDSPEFAAPAAPAVRNHIFL